MLYFIGLSKKNILFSEASGAVLESRYGPGCPEFEKRCILVKFEETRERHPLRRIDRRNTEKISKIKELGPRLEAESI